MEKNFSIFFSKGVDIHIKLITVSARQIDIRTIDSVLVRRMTCRLVVALDGIGVTRGGIFLCALSFAAGAEFDLASRDLAAHVAQSAEHILGKDEVSGSTPLVGSTRENREFVKLD